MLSLTMPLGASLMKWPPDLLCASRGHTGRLGLWRLCLSLGHETSAQLQPLDDFSETFDADCSGAFPRQPKFALDLEANVVISFDKTLLQVPGPCQWP